MEMEKVFNGILDYNENADYVLESTQGRGSVNISGMLNKVYYADTNSISIKIMDGCKTLFNEEGNIYLKNNQFGIYSYHIDGEDLEHKLFNNTGKELEITISAEALKGNTHDL